MAAPNRQALRIQRDIEELNKNPLNFIENLQCRHLDESDQEKIDECFYQITGVLVGPVGSDYEGGRFKFILRFPPEYPFRPPEVNFLTRIVHPNVDSKTGVVCHDRVIATWTAKVTLTEILTKVHELLANPNYQTPIQGDDTTAQKNPERARESARASIEQSNNV